MATVVTLCKSTVAEICYLPCLSFAGNTISDITDLKTFKHSMAFAIDVTGASVIPLCCHIKGQHAKIISHIKQIMYMQYIFLYMETDLLLVR